MIWYFVRHPVFNIGATYRIKLNVYTAGGFVYTTVNDNSTISGRSQLLYLAIYNLKNEILSMNPTCLMDITLQNTCFLEVETLRPADRPSRERKKYLKNLHFQNKFYIANVKNEELKSMICEKWKRNNALVSDGGIIWKAPAIPVFGYGDWEIQRSWNLNKSLNCGHTEN